MPYGWSDFQSTAPTGAVPPPQAGPGPGDIMGQLPQGIDPRMIQMLLQQALQGQQPPGPGAGPPAPGPGGIAPGPQGAPVPPRFDNQGQGISPPAPTGTAPLGPAPPPAGPIPGQPGGVLPEPSLQDARMLAFRRLQQQRQLGAIQ